MGGIIALLVLIFAFMMAVSDAVSFNKVTVGWSLVGVCIAIMAGTAWDFWKRKS